MLGQINYHLAPGIKYTTSAYSLIPKNDLIRSNHQFITFQFNVKTEEKQIYFYLNINILNVYKNKYN